MKKFRQLSKLNIFKVGKRKSCDLSLNVLNLAHFKKRNAFDKNVTYKNYENNVFPNFLLNIKMFRIAGTRTKMELAWQKERDSQKKLINELNTMARDLKSTLLVKR